MQEIGWFQSKRTVGALIIAAGINTGLNEHVYGDEASIRTINDRLATLEAQTLPSIPLYGLMEVELSQSDRDENGDTTQTGDLSVATFELGTDVVLAKNA